MKRLYQTVIVLAGLLHANALLAKTLELEACHLKGIKQQVLCGKLSVPENYDKPDGKQIELNVAILPAIDNSTYRTPMMFLAGGPGQPATSIAAMVRRSHRDILKTRDIILVDQRGTGESEGLTCDAIEDQDAYTTVLASTNFPVMIRNCLAEFTQDLRQYNSENAIRDFDAVRQALGHEKINLYGGSYGTRAALVYMRLFPQVLETVTLDSVGPIEVPIGLFGQSAARAFNLMLADCQASDACNAAFPNLAAEFEALAQRLSDTSVELTIAHPRLATNTPFLLDKNKLISSLQFQLYGARSRAMMPYVIHQAYLENYMPLAGLIAQTEFGIGVNTALTMNIVCNEDLARASDTQIQHDSNNIFSQDNSYMSFKRICDHWPSYQVDDAFYEPVTAGVPTLVLSGDLDPVTPPSNGEIAHESLPNSRHIIAPRVAHIVAGKGCASKMIAQFIDTQDAQSLDESCLNEIPSTPFVTNVNGSL